MRHLALLALCLSLCSLPAKAEGEGTEWGRIGAVETTVVGREAGGESRVRPQYDILRLDTEDQLMVSFDLLGGDTPLLEYRLTHCNADWRTSVLRPIEYVRGFASGELASPTISRNTLQPYAHYRISVPSAETELRVSGNFYLDIHDPTSATPEEPILRVPFSVSEQSLGTYAEVTTDTPLAIRQAHQQVNIHITKTEGIIRPEQELKVVVLQNGRWDNAQHLSRPSGITLQGRIDYQDMSGALFWAGSEYAKVEHLTERGIGLGVQSASLESDGLYRLVLAPIHRDWRESYRYEADHNGIQIIRTLHGDEPDTEADYQWLTFSLVSPPLPEELYVEGEATRYLPLERRRMYYNYDRGAYEATLLLKMGYQEYTILSKQPGATALAPTETVGSHYQTTNGYTILVYRRSPGDRADRLVGDLHL